MNLEQIVTDFKTEHSIGFNSEEQQVLIESLELEDFDLLAYQESLVGITCATSTKGLIVYPQDILIALRCATEKRKATVYEWD